MTFLPVAEYRPDAAYLKSDATGDLKNVLCGDGFYIPVPGFSQIGTIAFPDDPRGSKGVITLQDQVLVFLGTQNKLYVLRDPQAVPAQGGGFIDVSNPDTPYNLGPEDKWSFAVFGSLIIAASRTVTAQVYDFGPGSTGKFRDLGTKADEKLDPKTWYPPLGGVVKTWGNFVAIMDQPSKPNRVTWSDLNNADHWINPDAINPDPPPIPGPEGTVWLSDSQIFSDGGKIMGSNETTNPIIFLQSAIYAATFVPGSDIIFSFQKIHDQRGVKSSSSIASRDNLIFFADQGGFQQMSTDGTITPIGFEKVDRTYFQGTRSLALGAILGVVDPYYNRVYWALNVRGDATSPVQRAYDTILVYDWVLQKWTVIDLVVRDLVPIFSFGTTLEGLDWFCRANDQEYPCNDPEGCEISGEPIPYNPASIEKLPYTMDSKIWQSQSPVLMGIGQNTNGSLFLGSFNGPNMEASVTSQELGPTDRQMMRLNGVMPVVDNENVQIYIGRRNVPNMSTNIDWLPKPGRYFDDPNSGYRQSVNTGFVHARSRARYHRFRIRIPEGEQWSNMSGIDVTATPSGLR